MESGNEILKAQHFDSFEELADIATFWNADFRQISPEESKSVFFQAMFGPLLLSHGRFGCFVEQRGETPAGMLTFAIPDPASPPMRWFGHTINSDTLLLFPQHREIEVFSRPGFSTMTFSIQESSLKAFFDKHGGGPELEKIFASRGKPVSTSSVLCNRLRTLLQMAVELLKRGKDTVTEYRLRLSVQNEILFLLLDIYQGGSGTYLVPKKHRMCSMERLLQHVQTHTHEPITVADLCSVGQISERSLRNIFNRELGMSPKCFLRGRRLNEAHRKLWSADSSNTLVTEIANQIGFWHMGQFAADYKKVFGELPSQTLQRLPGSPDLVPPL